MTDQRPPSGRTAGIPAATTGWALTGSLLLVPSLLLGPLAPRLIDCFDCPDPSPLAAPSLLLDLVLLVGLPVIAVGLALTVRSGLGRSGWSGWLAWIGFVASALVVGQAVVAILGVPGFEFFVPVGPAAVIATIGFGFAIGRPAFLAGVGSWSAAAGALVGLAWMSGTAAGTFGPIDAPVVQGVTLVAGALVIVGLGREFAMRPDVPAADEGRVPPR